MGGCRKAKDILLLVEESRLAGNQTFFSIFLCCLREKKRRIKVFSWIKVERFMSIFQKRILLSA